MPCSTRFIIAIRIIWRRDIDAVRSTPPAAPNPGFSRPAPSVGLEVRDRLLGLLERLAALLEPLLAVDRDFLGVSLYLARM